MDEQYNKPGFTCCFCNQGIIENQTDPIYITVGFNEDSIYKTEDKQLFFAHYDCFKQNLHILIRKQCANILAISS
jgi:hypothetical protein